MSFRDLKKKSVVKSEEQETCKVIDSNKTILNLIYSQLTTIVMLLFFIALILSIRYIIFFIALITFTIVNSIMVFNLKKKLLKK